MLLEQSLAQPILSVIIIFVIFKNYLKFIEIASGLCLKFCSYQRQPSSTKTLPLSYYGMPEMFII